MSLVPYHSRDGREIVLYVISVALPTAALLRHPQLGSLACQPSGPHLVSTAGFSTEI